MEGFEWRRLILQRVHPEKDDRTNLQAGCSRSDVPLPRRHIYGANLHQTLFSASVWIPSACGSSAGRLLDAARSSFLSNDGLVCSDDLNPQMCDYLSQITSRFVRDAVCVEDTLMKTNSECVAEIVREENEKKSVGAT